MVVRHAWPGNKPGFYMPNYLEGIRIYLRGCLPTLTSLYSFCLVTNSLQTINPQFVVKHQIYNGCLTECGVLLESQKYL